MNSHDPLLDHRARMERAQLEAGERRAQAMLEQRSPENSHDARVRAWEKLHQVRLPRDPEHNVLVIIAQQTGLTLDAVQEVQRQRNWLADAAKS
jgi:hypothetical protein